MNYDHLLNNVIMWKMYNCFLYVAKLCVHPLYIVLLDSCILICGSDLSCFILIAITFSLCWVNSFVLDACQRFYQRCD